MRYLHLLRNLPKHEMDVTVYTMKWWGKDPPNEQTPFGSLSYKAICPRIRMYRGRKRSMTQAVFFAASTFRLMSYNFDVIEADHMPYLQLFPLRIVAWLKRVPLVVTWNEVWGDDGWYSYLGKIGHVASLVERLCIRLPDAIVAISDGTAEKLTSMGANCDQIVVVPMALDLERLSAITPDELAPRLLFVGRLIEHKHAELAVAATEILLSRGHQVHLGIVGTGPEEARLVSQVADSHLENQVTFYSNIESQDELWSIIRGSEVLLAPSVREGFGILVAESLALGTPVICALHPDNESSKLVSSNTGTVVRPYDAMAIADAAERWLRDFSDRKTRISTFLSENPHLTVEAMITSYADLFRSSV